MYLPREVWAKINGRELWRPSPRYPDPPERLVEGDPFETFADLGQHRQDEIRFKITEKSKKCDFACIAI